MLFSVIQFLLLLVVNYRNAAGRCYLNAAGHCYLNAAEHCYLNAAEHCYLNASENCYLHAAEDCYLNAAEHCYLNAAEHCYLNAAEHCYLIAWNLIGVLLSHLTSNLNPISFCFWIWSQRNPILTFMLVVRSYRWLIWSLWKWNQHTIVFYFQVISHWS